MGSLISKLFWIRFLSTPYPWIGLAVGVTMFTIIIGILAYKKSTVLDLPFFAVLILMLAGLIGMINSFDSPADTPKLDNKKLDVFRCTNYGLRLETGGLVVPAGCSFVPIGNPHWKSPKPALREFVGDGKVLLKWSDDMLGYEISNESGEDLGSYLVSRGLVRTKSLASEELMSLEREARANKIGIWEKTWRGTTEERKWPEILCIVLFSLAILSSAVLVVLEYKEV